MPSLREIKLFHVLYFLGAITVAIHICGTLNFVLHPYERWGKYELDVFEQVIYFYFLLSPIVLAYHIQRGSTAGIKLEAKRDKLERKIIRVARFIYLVSVELAVLFFFSILIWFALSEGNIQHALWELEILLSFIAGLIGMATSGAILIMTIKLR